MQMMSVQALSCDCSSFNCRSSSLLPCRSKTSASAQTRLTPFDRRGLQATARRPRRCSAKDPSTHLRYIQQLRPQLLRPSAPTGVRLWHRRRSWYGVHSQNIHAGLNSESAWSPCRLALTQGFKWVKSTFHKIHSCILYTLLFT